MAFRIRKENSSTFKAAVHPTKLNLAYAAGLFEGEGWFTRPQIHKNKSGGVYTPGTVIGLTMTDIEPVEEMFKLFGGSLKPVKTKQPNRKQAWRWMACGARARGIAMTIYPWLSPRRQQRIKEFLV